jgi:hypothetical protein
VSADVNPVLGRYGGEVAGDEELVAVQLLNFPLQLFAQARQHHDELVREFALLAMRPPTEGDGRQVPARLVELIRILGGRYRASGERTDAVRDAALDRGDVAIDLTYHLPPSALETIQMLHSLMEDADRFCEQEQLLTLAATPIERAFRQWYLEQFTTQLAGGRPVPYDGPMRDDSLPL